MTTHDAKNIASTSCIRFLVMQKSAFLDVPGVCTLLPANLRMPLQIMTECSCGCSLRFSNLDSLFDRLLSLCNMIRALLIVTGFYITVQGTFSPFSLHAVILLYQEHRIFHTISQKDATSRLVISLTLRRSQCSRESRTTKNLCNEQGDTPVTLVATPRTALRKFAAPSPLEHPGSFAVCG
jgi:hypothetical protein